MKCFFSHGRRGRGGLISGPKISSAGRPGVGLGAPIILVSPIPHPDFSGPPENSPRAMAHLTPKPKIFRRVKFSEESTWDSRTTNAKQKTQLKKNRTTRRLIRIAKRRKCCECVRTRPSEMPYMASEIVSEIRPYPSKVALSDMVSNQQHPEILIR